MAERALEQKVEEIRKSGANVYSISRLNCMNQCEYQAFLNYIANIPQENNVWSVLGGRIHDALQDCVDNGTDEKCVMEAIDDELDTLGTVYGLDFPLDRNGKDTIRQNWISNMTEFAKVFKTPKGEFKTEQLVLYQVGENDWMQGYIDLIRFNKNGTISIFDWKTSSQFTKDHLVEAGRQLCLYAMGKEAEGYKVDRVAWVMMKYCVAKWVQESKNGAKTTKTKVCEWRNLGREMRGVVEKALYDAGYDDFDSEIYLNDMVEHNSMAGLPENIRKMFNVGIYVREYELTDDVRSECLDYIRRTIAKFKEKGTEEANFSSCDIGKNSFYCQSLCGYGGKSGKCKYWVDFCSKFGSKKDDEDDIF